jgi:hypothetical protein
MLYNMPRTICSPAVQTAPQDHIHVQCRREARHVPSLTVPELSSLMHLLMAAGLGLWRVAPVCAAHTWCSAWRAG